MFSWLTGSKMADDVDDTCIEPPETPAPVFAVRAVKHAIFGTPQPPPTVVPTRLAKKRKEVEKVDAVDIPAPLVASETEAASYSPTKQGILLTPGTVRGKKKEVTFGSQVVDNESKKPSRTGLPNNYPGKFPSPWTPKVADLPDGKRPKTKLTEALYEAKATGTTPKKPKVRAKDDTDITLDLMEPKSLSGKHWKEQYMSHAEKCEEQIGKLNAKYKLCKDHARKKDDEAKELRRQLESSSKRHRTREMELEKQIKEFREQLRLQMAENAKTSTEISLLRRQLEDGSVESSTSKLKRAIAQRFEPSDSIWVDEGAREEVEQTKTKTYLQAAVVQTRGEHARSNRNHRERRLARKDGSVARQDSLVTPSEKVDPFDSELERSPTPRPSKDISKSLRRILGDMSPNIASSPPVLSFFSEADFKTITTKAGKSLSDTETQKPKSQSPTHREAMAEAAASLSRKRDFSILEDLAPMSALSLQAEQPVTPDRAPRAKGTRSREMPSTSARMHKRSDAASAMLGASAGLDGARAKAAKDRLAARRAKKHTRAR
jgi:hypothetical protein